MSTNYLRTFVITALCFAVLALITPAAMADGPSAANADNAEYVLGLGRGSNGWMEFRDGTNGGYNHMAWRQVPWSVYNGRNGETFPAAGYLDNDALAEYVIGLGETSNCWMQIRNDSGTGYAHIRWLQVPWPAYCTSNGQTHPSLGNIDGGNLDEMAIGLGTGANGWFEIRDDSGTNYAHKRWLQVPWSTYNSANGLTRPVLGDIDCDGLDEIVIGLGRKANGWMQVRDDANHGYAHLRWIQVPWSTYNGNNGETRPALGDLDNDGCDEIVIGLGPGANGWVQVRDDAAHGYAHLSWEKVNYAAYNANNGSTRPAVDSLQAGGEAEIVLGLGTGSNCWHQIRDGASTNYNFLAWRQAPWSTYCSANGDTRPSAANLTPALAAMRAAVGEPAHISDGAVDGPMADANADMSGPQADMSVDMSGPQESKSTAAELAPSAADAAIDAAPQETGEVFAGPEAQ